MSRNLLVVTNSDETFKSVSRIVEKLEFKVNSVKRVEAIETFANQAIDHSDDLVILDLEDLNLSDIETVDKVKSLDPDIPLILIKSDFSLEEAIKLVKAGASDLIKQGELEEKLAGSITSVFGNTFEYEKNLKISDLNRDLEEVLNNHIINSLPGIFYVINKEGQIISVNNRFRELIDYKPGDDNHFTKFVAEEDVDASVQSFLTTLKYSASEVELRIKTKDGDKIPYLLSGITTTINNETIMVGTGVDINDRKQTEKDLLNEQAFIDKTLNSLPGLFYVLDEDMNYIRVNQYFIDRLGYSWVEIQNMNPLDFYFREDHERIENIIKESFVEGSASITAQLKTKDGSHPHFYLTGSFFKQDGKNYILGTGVDITEQVRMESLLEQAQRMVKIGAWELDVEKGRVNWTDVVKEILEVDKDYNPNLQDGLDFYVGESKMKITNAVNKAIESGESYDLELKVKSGKGNIKWIRTIGEAIFHNGKCVRLHGSFQDITEKKLADERIKESLKEKEILLMEVHHRVKNNLALVSGLMQLQAYQTDDEMVYKYLEDNQTRIKSIALIHDQLYQNDNFTNVRLDEQTENLIKHLSDSIANGKDIRVELELDEVEVNINQAVPYTLLLNEVVTNAYKHAFNEAEKGEIHLTLKSENNLVSLKVKDDGKGLDRDIDLESPSSLGMTLVKTLSDQLQGTLNIESGDSGLSVDLTFKRNDQLRGAASSLV